MEITTLTDTDLDALRVSVINEQERRANLATIPPLMADLAARFIQGGGDQALIEAAVAPKQ